MKVLIDMNLSTDWVDLLASHGHEAVHWSSIGRANAGDGDLIAFATSGKFIILTNDLDFGITLVTQGLAEPSIIQLRSKDLRPSLLGEAVLLAMKDNARDLAHGAIVTVDQNRKRFRLLNLGENR